MADEPSHGGVNAARPIIRIDGTVQSDLGDAMLQTLEVEETTLGLFRCEAHFTNWGPKNGQVGFLFYDRQMLDFGKTLAVEFSTLDTSSSVFAGRISAIEGHYPHGRAPEITVLAEDRFQDLRMERRTRSFENVTDADVVRRIASQYGLTAQVDLDGPTYPVLAQVNQSDLAFLRERVLSVDGDLWIDDRTLYAQTRSKRSSGSLTLTYGATLVEFSVLADLAHQRTAVKVSGWDIAGKQAIDEEAGESAITPELNGGRSGSSVLGQALAQRRERIAVAVPLNQQEAQRMAQARYRQRARRFVKGSGVAEGNPKLRVGSILDLQGLGPLFEGKYYVTLARHSFDPEFGYRTHFEVERPGVGG